MILHYKNLNIETINNIFMFSTQDSILILIVVLILFGANKLPEMARSLGKATVENKTPDQIIEEIRSKIK